jgi:hypothetical protein
LAQRVPSEVAIINGASLCAVCDSQFSRKIRKTAYRAIVQKNQSLIANNSAAGARMMADAVVRHDKEIQRQF